MIKKYITIIVASLMMLLPALSSAHHYDRETAFRNNVHNTVWKSDILTPQQIPSPDNQHILKTFQARVKVLGYEENTRPPNRDGLALEVTYLLTYTDGTIQKYKTTHSIMSQSETWVQFDANDGHFNLFRIYEDHVVGGNNLTIDMSVWTFTPREMFVLYNYLGRSHAFDIFKQ